MQAASSARSETGLTVVFEPSLSRTRWMRSPDSKAIVVPRTGDENDAVVHLRVHPTPPNLGRLLIVDVSLTVDAVVVQPVGKPDDPFVVWKA